MLTNLSDIDLRLLRVFVAVAEAHGVSAAQEPLLMNQSTISTHLATLETRLGFRLCQRGRSGFMLTPKGERILIACRTLFNAARDFTRVSQSLNGLLTGDLQIGLVDNLVSLPGNPFSRAIKQFQRRHQDVQLQCRICAPGEIEQGLLNQQLDLGIGYFGQQLEALQYQPWISEMQAVYCSSDHPLFTAEQPGREQIENARWVKRGYLLAQQLCPLAPLNLGAVAHHMEGVAHLVLSGEYLGYLPTHYAARWVEQGALRQLGGQALSYQATLSLVTRPGAPKEALLALIEDLSGLARAPQTKNPAGAGSDTDIN
ncbi:CysJI operon transcriptional activator [Serratia liquefaciens]|uniref:LysR family transcriptional regulator n=1 Tax=Serratia liquefaciens TaxID=614 RepID=UPI00217A0887|nr:LysR family transcriptional regulator [Serratia liquefaciens]MDU4172394.1 LysR family transcriptional regulator [Serratia liquefaciens]CAI0929354.1 CysJI operon transcriptional activator [Serratia liquefaciens]